MAKYTASPLGLLEGVINNNGTPTSLSVEIIGNGDEFNNVFTGWKNNNTRHFLRKSNKKYAGILSTSPHSQDVYDISTTNIIEKLGEFEHLKLSYADFAYNKEFGVYPNNRLIVCRRYPTGVVDDLYSVPQSTANKPLSTVVGYVKDESFLEFKVSENYTDSDVSFLKLLNELGEDFGSKSFKIGDILAGGVNVIPLPGASLLFQRQIMANLGLFGEGTKYDTGTGKFVKANGETTEVPPVPQGDPNLIKQARVRSLIDEDQSGSGLKCKISVDFTVVYEQKFINGNDPTLIYASILHNLLNMGTSKASFYLGKQTDKDEDVLKFLNKLTSDPLQVITDFIQSIIDTIKGAASKLEELISGVKDDPAGAVKDATTTITSALGDISSTLINFIKEKYKIKFVGIINALTGGPSTPWHVTIGNPLRPIFCSGDMECTGVDIKLGPQLSFNDLPTYIEAKITLTSARDLGLQEIFAKLNAGGIRVVESQNGTKSSDHDYFISISDDFNNGGYGLGNRTTSNGITANANNAINLTNNNN
jgi:hypothetical protein